MSRSNSPKRRHPAKPHVEPMWPAGYCPHGGKRQWRTKAEAKRALKGARKTRAHQGGATQTRAGCLSLSVL